MQGSGQHCVQMPWKVMTDNLELFKKSTHWVPKILTSEQKAERVMCARHFLAMVEEIATFLDTLITMDETSFVTPEIKKASLVRAQLRP